jgi:MFS family permease
LGAYLDRARAAWPWLLLGSLVASALICLALMALLNSAVFALAAYTTVFALGVFGLVTTTLWQTCIPYFVGEDKDAVKRVMGWTASTFTAGAAVGPLLASLVARHAGTAQLILWDVVSFLICAGLLIPAVRRLRAGIALADTPGPRARAEWLVGLRRIFAEPLVRLPAVALAVMNFVTFGVDFALPTLVVRRHLPDYLIAWLTASFVVGTMVGSMVATRFRRDRHFVAYLVGEPFLRGLALLVVALSASAPVLLCATLLFTVPQGLGRVARSGFMMTCFPGAQRAKIVGSYQMLVRSLMPAAPLAMQGLVAAMGITAFFVVSAVVLALLSAVVASDRALRRAWSALREPVGDQYQVLENLST